MRRGSAWWRTLLERSRGASRATPAAGSPVSGPGSSEDKNSDPDLLMPGMLEMLGERDLCALWQRCQREVEESGETAARDQFERLRNDCIAELTRRNPEAISAWLAGGETTLDELKRFVGPADQTTPDAT